MNNKPSDFLNPWLSRLGVAVAMSTLCYTSQARAHEIPVLPIPVQTSTAQPVAADSNTTLHPGEVLDLSVVQGPPIDGRYKVLRGGYIILPAVGRVFVADRSLDEATKAVGEATEAALLDHTVIKLEVETPAEATDASSPAGNFPSAAATSVIVIGGLNNPCYIPLKPNERLDIVAAIINAGGLDSFTRHKTIYILRTKPDGGKIRIPVNLVAMIHNQNEDSPLHPGDIVVVPVKYLSY